MMIMVIVQGQPMSIMALQLHLLLIFRGAFFMPSIYKGAKTKLPNSRNQKR